MVPRSEGADRIESIGDSHQTCPYALELRVPEQLCEARFHVARQSEDRVHHAPALLHENDERCPRVLLRGLLLHVSAAFDGRRPMSAMRRESQVETSFSPAQASFAGSTLPDDLVGHDKRVQPSVQL
jgi:hypothetical protein